MIEFNISTLLDENKEASTYWLVHVRAGAIASGKSRNTRDERG